MDAEDEAAALQIGREWESAAFAEVSLRMEVEDTGVGEGGLLGSGVDWMIVVCRCGPRAIILCSKRVD